MIVVALLLTLVPATDALDRDLVALMSQHHVPGMQVALMKGSQLLRYGNYGYADLETKREVGDDTSFEMASISKTFTGLAIRMLLNDGKLRLDSKVSEFLPLSARWKRLEVHHLIGMSMGLGDDWDHYPWGDVSREFDRESTLRFFDTMEQRFPIGEQHEYCSPAYALLGMIIDRLTGRHFSEFMERRIFGPAGMSHTSFMRPGARQPGKAVGYRFDGKKVQRGFRITPYLHGRADVGMISTVKDMVKFVRALDAKLLVQNPNALWTGALADDGLRLPYGYGWYVEAPNGVPYHYHGGLFRTGYRSMLMRFPRQRVTIIVAMNNYGAPVRDFVRTVTKHLAPEIVVPD